MTEFLPHLCHRTGSSYNQGPLWESEVPSPRAAQADERLSPHGSRSPPGPAWPPGSSHQAPGRSQAGCLTHLLSLKRIRWLCSRMAMRALGSYSAGLRKARPSGSPCTASSPGSRSSLS